MQAPRPVLPLAGVLVALVLAGVAGGARLGDGASRDPAGDVAASGLSATEKRAVDLASMRVTGAKGLGVFVTATFRGNVEAALGRGRLGRAGVALVLRPRAKNVSSAGLVSVGTGKVGRLYRHTSSKDVGVYRKGKTVHFWLLGPGYERVKSVAVETVLNARVVTGKALLDDTPYIGQRLWDRFVTLHPIDLHVQVADPSGLTCAELKDLVQSIDADLDDPYFSQNVSFAVVRALHKFRNKVNTLLANCGQSPTVGAAFAWTRFSSNEVAGSGRFTGPAHTFSGVRIVLPEEYDITNHLCPIQLPNATISGNSITCGGGSLGTGEAFRLNLQTSPVPPNDVGGRLFGVSGGTTFGPFAVTGP